MSRQFKLKPRSPIVPSSYIQINSSRLFQVFQYHFLAPTLCHKADPFQWWHEGNAYPGIMAAQFHFMPSSSYLGNHVKAFPLLLQLLQTNLSEKLQS